jgi:geranylgeranyl diphosphate synthase type I
MSHPDVVAPVTGRRPSAVSVLPLPTPRATEQNKDFLRQVDQRLADVVDDLLETWGGAAGESAGSGEEPPGGPEVDILQDRDLPELMRSLTATGGKRIRPIMCFWGWVAAGGRDAAVAGGRNAIDGRPRAGHAAVVQAGAALELLHIFALIHDDVMDESASRRGRPSVHTLATQLHLHSGARGRAQRFGESIAILVGDLAHAEADHLVNELPPEMRRIWRVLVIELVLGQSRDLTGTAAGRRDLAHARQVARMKSGAYTVQRPLELGAAAAGAGPRVTEAIRRYGCEIGEAFALRDDLLGVWGDPGLTGKPAGDDLLSGKPTVILSLAHERLQGTARGLLARVGTPELSPADVGLLQDALAAGGVVEAVERRIAEHVHTAVAALERADLDADGVVGLTQMAHRIAWRDR